MKTCLRPHEIYIANSLSIYEWVTRKLIRQRVSKYAVYKNLKFIHNTDQYLSDQIFSITDGIFQIDDN